MRRYIEARRKKDGQVVRFWFPMTEPWSMEAVVEPKGPPPHIQIMQNAEMFKGHLRARGFEILNEGQTGDP